MGYPERAGKARASRPTFVRRQTRDGLASIEASLGKMAGTLRVGFHAEHARPMRANSNTVLSLTAWVKLTRHVQRFPTNARKQGQTVLSKLAKDRESWRLISPSRKPAPSHAPQQSVRVWRVRRRKRRMRLGLIRGSGLKAAPQGARARIIRRRGGRMAAAGPSVRRPGATQRAACRGCPER